MFTQIDSLDLSGHWQLINRLAGRAVAVIVSSVDGETVWTSPGVDRPSACNLVSRILDKSIEALRTNRIVTATREDTDAVSTALFAPDGTLSAVMIALASSSAGDKQVLVKAVSTVRKFVSRELCLTWEVAAVSEELGERYEELNLLYSTEECLQYFDDSAAATRQLVEKTNMHLDVDGVVLALPDRNVVVHHLRADAPVCAPELEKLTTIVLRAAEQTSAPLVANDEKDSDGGELVEKLGMKCLAIPFFNARGVVEGVLVALNRRDATSFSNSDRNLLEVMARRIRWVLESNRDTLTGLLARKAFEQRLTTGLALTRSTRKNCSVLYINIDRLHVINDMCGPHAGDAVICAIAGAIEELAGGENTAARLAGDEFGVLLQDSDVDSASRIAKNLCERVAALDFVWEGTPHDLSVSVGVALITPGTTSIDEVLSAAEIACTEAKEAGGGRTRALRQHDTVLVMRQNQMKWIGRVGSALRESRFELFAQRIQPLNADDASVHHEILLRLRGEDDQLVTPDEFLPSAERYNLMPDIDRWVIENAFERLACHWRELDEDVRAHDRQHVSWAINLSGQSMCDVRMLKFIVEKMQHSGLPPETICFEITESAAVSNISDARRLIAALRARGCKFSLDDFGTGVSSFAYLKNLPVDYLKIDGSFVRPILEDVASDAVVAAISQIAKALQLRTIAEFVETIEIAERLREIGIDFGQGYAYARPVPLAGVLEHRASRVEVVA